MAEALVWKPDNGNATINPDPAEQEAFLVLNATDPDATVDVQVKLRPDAIFLRRDSDQGWKGIKIDEGDVTVLVNGIEIRIGADGAITRTDEDSTTWVEPDGYILRKTDFVEASLSADGENLTRRTPNESLCPHPSNASRPKNCPRTGSSSKASSSAYVRAKSSRCLPKRSSA